MAGKKQSKNNPDARNKPKEVPNRTCEICGKTGPIGEKIIKILRGKVSMWLCKEMNGCR